MAAGSNSGISHVAKVGIGKKKVKVSKNRKKGWRKHVDINEIEEHLEEKIKDEILGGPASEKLDEQLFFVDKEVKDTDLNKVSEKPNWRDQPLRCFQALLPNSQVPPPIIPRVIRKRKPRKDQNLEGVKRKALANFEIAERNRERAAKAKEAKKEVHLSSLGTYDLWDSKNANKSSALFPNGVADIFKDDIRYRTCKVPKTYLNKTSALPAVEVPDPGASYNPDFAAYQKLILKAHLVEVKKLKEERRLQRVLTKFSALNPPKEDAWLHEMSQGIAGLDDAAGSTDEEPYAGPLSINPPVRRDKKKPANKRRKEKVRKKMEMELKKKKLDVQKQNEIYRIKALKAEVLKEENESLEHQAKRRKTEEFRQKYCPAILGRNKYEAPDIEVLLAKELPNSMRTMITDGCLMQDRLKSLQRRNIVEPRKKQTRYKLRTKTYPRKGHED